LLEKKNEVIDPIPVIDPLHELLALKRCRMSTARDEYLRAMNFSTVGIHGKLNGLDVVTGHNNGVTGKWLIFL